MAGISEGEVAVYDRQLRLWGVQAQQRLLKARVLVWGLGGCSVEACKNLVLAGVSLTIRDHRKATVADAAFNYFLRPEDVGKCRASAAGARVQEMNPLCTVSFQEEAVGESDVAKSVEGFDVVIMSFALLGYNAAQAAKIDAACRKSGSVFMLHHGVGEMAFFISDMNKHVMQERSGAQGGAGATHSEKAEAPVSEEFQFPSLDEWMGVAPEEVQRMKADDSIVFVSLMMAFSRASGGLAPDAAAKFESFCKEAKCVPNVDGMQSLSHAYACVFVEPLMHVASIVAGLMTQEVIKAITMKDPPLVNTVCFNSHSNAALVERIPSAPKVAVKRKLEDVADLSD